LYSNTSNLKKSDAGCSTPANAPEIAYAADRCVQDSNVPSMTQWNNTGASIQTGMDCNGGVFHTSGACDSGLMRIYTAVADPPDVSAAGFSVEYSISATCDPTQVFKTEYYVGDFSLTCGNYEFCKTDGGSTFEFFYCGINNRIYRETGLSDNSCDCITQGTQYASRVATSNRQDVTDTCVEDPNDLGLYRKFGTSCVANNRMLTKIPLISLFFFLLFYINKICLIRSTIRELRSVYAL